MVIMQRLVKKILVGWWVAVSIFATSTYVQADALLDFTFFNPPTSDQRKINEPIINWLVRSDAQTYCDQVEPKDGFHSRPEGCVYWLRKTASCTIVTTNNTTHSQLGHLFVRCMQGQ
jgi:hypothetical protein